MQRFKAETSELDSVIEYVNSRLEKEAFPDALVPVIDIAVEEIFVNIASYAYPLDYKGECYADIDIEVNNEGMSLTFKDAGTRYNPLEKPDPDVTLSAEERGIGGLGIFMVKQSMDLVTYEYKGGENILKIVKSRG